MSQDKQDFDILDFASKTSKVIEDNFKILLGLFVVAVIGGAVYSFVDHQNRQQEMQAFTELYKITKIYNDKKNKYDEAKAALDEKNDPKQKSESNADDSKKDLQAATGDLDKDYPQVPERLQAFIEKHKGNNASGEAALILSEIYDDYNMPDKGAAQLDKVIKNWGSENVLFFVMQMRAGDLYAGSNDCDSAIPYWQEVANSKSFISKQAQLKLGVCLQKVGRLEEAKQWFNQLVEADPNSTEGFSAKRYLRFLKFKSKVETDEKSDDKAQNKNTKKDQAS